MPKIENKHKPVLKALKDKGHEFVPSDTKPFKDATRYELKGFEGVIYLDVWKNCKASVFDNNSEAYFLDLVCKTRSCGEQEKTFKPLKKGGHNYQLMASNIENAKTAAKTYIEKVKRINSIKAYNKKVFKQVEVLVDKLNDQLKYKWSKLLDINIYPRNSNGQYMRGKCSVYMGNKLAYLTPGQTKQYINYLDKMVKAGVYDKDDED